MSILTDGAAFTDAAVVSAPQKIEEVEASDAMAIDDTASPPQSYVIMLIIVIFCLMLSSCHVMSLMDNSRL